MKKYFSLLLILLPIVTVFGQNLRGTDIKQVSNITAGTAAANKALVLNASKDISSIRNLTVSGIITIDTIMVGSTQWDIPTSDSINGAVIAAGSIPSAGLVLAKDLVTTAPITGGVDNILPGTDSDVTIALTLSKDLVAGDGLGGGEDDVFPGAEADVTVAVLLNVAGGLETVDDSINVKLDGSTLAVSTSGLKLGTISSDNLSDVTSIGMLDEAETISENWVNTANPWDDNEVADDITVSNYVLRSAIDDTIAASLTVKYKEAWVTSASQNPVLVTLPANATVLSVECWVSEAFTSDAADEVTVGYDALANAYATAIDVSGTGVKTVTLGATAKTVDATSRDVEIYYVNGGSEPGAGKAHVSITWIQSTVSP